LWVLPVLLAVVATGYLAWGAWVSAADQQWLYRGQEWWRVLLRPDDATVPLAVVVLWLVALACYWLLLRQPIVLTIVVAMVVIGGVLAAASLAPCRGGKSGIAVVGWVLGLYVGNPPPYPTGACTGQPPLALQLGGVVCLGATLAGGAAVAATLWYQSLRDRLFRDAVIVTGLDAMTIPFVYELARTGRPDSIVVIEPNAVHPSLDGVRAIGARVVIGQPTLPHVLLPIIAGNSGRALRRLYALREDVTENEAVLAAAKACLRRYRPDPERQPHLVARIDDPRHAEHWRGAHVGISAAWLEDALSANESTASALADQLRRTDAGQVLLCGGSTLALAILRELARRAWERQELAEAVAIGRANAPDGAGRLALAGESVHSVLLLDERADDLYREYLTTSPPSIARALPVIGTESAPWQSSLLGMLDGLAPGAAAQTAVVVADAPSEGSTHEAGRVARLHPDVPVFVLTSDGAGTSWAIFDRLQPYQRALLVSGHVPEGTWTRVARHWHECSRLRDSVPPGDPNAATRRPWAELDGFIRQDNILRLRSIMAAVAARGRHWVPGGVVPPGSFIELNGRDLEEVARAEHTRWYRRRLAAGWTAAPRTRTGRAAHAPVNSKVVPWDKLPTQDRANDVEQLRTQLAQLEDLGYMPVVPPGGPPTAAEFERVGTVRARQLHTKRAGPGRPGVTRAARRGTGVYSTTAATSGQ
jgi:hypothetical protein